VRFLFKINTQFEFGLGNDFTSGILFKSESYGLWFPLGVSALVRHQLRSSRMLLIERQDIFSMPRFMPSLFPGSPWRV